MSTTILALNDLQRVMDALIGAFTRNAGLFAVLAEEAKKPKNLYHGFPKYPISDGMLFQGFWDRLALPRDAVQVELVGVLSDLSKQVHVHERSTALIYCLGGSTSAPPPRDAYAYDHARGRWVPVAEDMLIVVPPGTPHGFTVLSEGWLWFLSVQNPPISGPDHDDFTVVDAAPFVAAGGD